MLLIDCIFTYQQHVNIEGREILILKIKQLYGNTKKLFELIVLNTSYMFSWHHRAACTEQSECIAILSSAYQFASFI